MVYKVLYKSSAEEDLSRLSPEDARAIVKKIAHYSESTNPMRFARKLKGLQIPTYRFRMGHYRAIFRLDPQSKTLVILVVLKIAHRKEIYRDMS